VTATRVGPPHSPAERPPSRVHDRYIRRSNYRTSRPATARPISIRWISLVPSKIVKILAIGAVYAGQRPAVPLGINTDSARPVRDEFRFPPGRCTLPIRVSTCWEGTADPGGSRRRPVTPAQVHRRYISALTCQFPSPTTSAADQRRGRGAHGPDALGTRGKPATAAVTPTRRRYGPDRP
jgi:hypothetical protein